jgi:hypothetical protein
MFKFDWFDYKYVLSLQTNHLIFQVNKLIHNSIIKELLFPSIYQPTVF